MRSLRYLVLATLSACSCGGRVGEAPQEDAGSTESLDDGQTSPGTRDSGAPVDATTPGDSSAPPAEAASDVQAEGPSDDGGLDTAPPNDLLDASFEASPAPDLDASTVFGWTQQAMIGSWIGTRTDPWDPPATVVVTFAQSGSYSAHCVVNDPNCLVWHYGTDADLPNKTYQLFDVHGNGTGESYIQIAFGSTSANQGQLDNIAIDPTATTMTMDFYPTWLGRIGPVHLDLVRQ